MEDRKGGKAPDAQERQSEGGTQSTTHCRGVVYFILVF